MLSGEAPNTKSMLWADQVCIYKPTGYVLMSRAGMYLWADRVCIHEPTEYVFMIRPGMYSLSGRVWIIPLFHQLFYWIMELLWQCVIYILFFLSLLMENGNLIVTTRHISSALNSKRLVVGGTLQAKPIRIFAFSILPLGYCNIAP